MPPWQPSLKLLSFTLLALLAAYPTVAVIMRFSRPPPALFAALSSLSLSSAQSPAGACGSPSGNVSLSWHPPAKSQINDLASAINGTGIYGFIFNSSQGPPDTYNWCNMPHTNPATYKVPDSSYELEYVEIIHRHHKRTPYADNTFPVEGYPWNCDDEGLFYGGQPINPAGKGSTDTYWAVYTSEANPFPPDGFAGTCQFPQITRGGLDDSHQHGADLRAVYADLLNFIPRDYDPDVVEYRVTNNVITSQVASMLTAGMYPALTDENLPLKIQPDGIDSLEPTYTCDYADALYASYGAGSNSSAWQRHLTASAALKTRLDALSGVDPADDAWSRSWDHYFDNLSARLCHAKPLPCDADDPTDCVSLPEAERVFRLGEYEYSFIYRDAPASLAASTASFGVWIAELARNLRAAGGEGGGGVRYRHNVAHDGSVSRLLSILQLEEMVWPGMGAEVVFELYRRGGCHFVRVLWGGRVLASSHPAFGQMDMVPVETLLGYFEGLAGVDGSKVPGLCSRDVGDAE